MFVDYSAVQTTVQYCADEPQNGLGMEKREGKSKDVQRNSRGLGDWGRNDRNWPRLVRTRRMRPKNRAVDWPEPLYSVHTA